MPLQGRGPKPSHSSSSAGTRPHISPFTLIYASAGTRPHTYPFYFLCRDEAPEEKAVKEEIESLRKKLELVRASGPDPESIADEVASAAEDVEAKVQELAALKVELDEKVRGHSGG